MKTGYIYGLRCPLTDQIKYVGQAVIPLNLKLKVLKQRTDGGLYGWLRKLRTENKIDCLLIEVLQNYIPIPDLNRCESFWINHLLPTGHLVNTELDGHVNRDNIYTPVVMGRLIAIDCAIRKSFNPTLVEIKAQVTKICGTKVSTRTIQLDIERMRKDENIKAPIEYNRVSRIYRYTESNYSLQTAI